MKKNIKGFSIVLAIGLVILINLIAINILDYIIPFSKDTKNIENSVVSYYQADSAIEDALFYLKQNNFVAGTESGTTLTSNPVSNSFDIEALGRSLPPVGEGNSDYDKDWEQIAIGNPIQLEIGYNKVNFSNAGTRFAFRIPNLKNGINLTLSGASVLPIINWQISSKNNTLNASLPYLIYPVNTCHSGQNFSDCRLNLYSRIGVDLDGNSINIGNFYTNNCGVGSSCILKLSIVNKLETTTGIQIPYLEWQFKFSTDVPLRYSIIETDGKAYGYKKSLKVRLPQQTTNEAFDFTVFQ